MATIRTAQYFVSGAGSNVTTFDLSYGSVSMVNNTMVFRGTSGVDQVYVGSGMSFDFTQSLGGADKLYFNGAMDDYEVINTGTNLLLSRTIDNTTVRVNAVGSLETLVFTDGVVQAQDLLFHVRDGAPKPVPDSSVLVSATSALSLVPEGTNHTATVRAFASDSVGVVFGQVAAGMSLIVRGTSGVESVYVAQGSNVDATSLLGGQDKIFVLGLMSSYGFSVSGTTLTATRMVGGHMETIKVVSGDSINFANGAVDTGALITAIRDGLPMPVPSGESTPGAVPDVTQLTPAALAGVEPEVLAFISDEQAALITPEQAAALTPQQVAALAASGMLDELSEAAIGDLVPGSLVNVANAHLAQQNPAFIGDLAPATLASLTDIQLDALTVAQVAEITAAQIDALTPAQVVALDADVSGLSASAAASLSPNQVAALAGTGLLDDLSVAAVGALVPDSLDGTSPANLALMPAAFIGALAPATLASVSAAQLGALTAAQVAAVTAAQIDALSPAQVAALGTDVSGMSTTAAASLDAAQVAAMAAAGTLDDLSVAATGALAVESLDNVALTDVTALPTAFIGALAPATLASVSDAQLNALTTAQVAVITAAQIDALTPAQVTALGTDVSGMSTTAAGSLDAVQVGALTALQSAVLTPAQVDALANAGTLDDLSTAAIGTLAVDSLDNISNAEVAALPDAFITALAPATLVSVSEAQVGSFTVAQAKAMTPAQLEALQTAGLFDNLSPAAQAAVSPTLEAVALDGQGSVDVRTNIVLDFSADVAAVAGKFIRIVDGTASGFHGESVTNTQTLAIDDPRVTISGSRVTINFEHDLDFSSNYHVEIDSGAFVSTVNGLDFAGITDATTVNFTTVAPTQAGVASTIADASGAMVQSLVWKDLEGIGGLYPATFDASTADYGFVFTDYSPRPADVPGRFDGVEANDLNVQMDNFRAGDLLYIDNYGRNDILNNTAITDLQDDVTHSRLIWDANQAFGATVQLNNDRFQSIGEWQTDLGVDYVPYVIA